MKIRIGFFIIAVCLTLPFSLVFADDTNNGSKAIQALHSLFASSPSLKETFDWMDSTYNDDMQHTVAFYNPAHEQFRNVLTSYTHNGCEINSHYQDNFLGTDNLWVTDDTFNLRDIDLRSVKLSLLAHYTGRGLCEKDSLDDPNCDSAFIELHTVNDKRIIDEVSSSTMPSVSKETNVKHEKTYVVDFYFSDPQYASRFAKALYHAIELCGGTSSPF